MCLFNIVWTLVLSCLLKQFLITVQRKANSQNLCNFSGTFLAAFSSIYLQTIAHGILMSFQGFFAQNVYLLRARRVLQISWLFTCIANYEVLRRHDKKRNLK
jgi:hypothetical protein